MASGYKGKIKQRDSYGCQFRGGLNDLHSSEHTEVIKRGICFVCPSSCLTSRLSLACSGVTTHPAPVAVVSTLSFPSLLLIILSLSAHGVLTLHPLPLPLSLSGTADGDYGPVLPFVLGPQRDQELFGQHTAQLPISHTKCRGFSFH